jgi:hypothetical protein
MLSQPMPHHPAMRMIFRGQEWLAGLKVFGAAIFRANGGGPRWMRRPG